MYCREPGSALSLGSVGSRRTVYLSEDDSGVPIVPAVTSGQTGSDVNSTAPPLLVYNRISTMIAAEPQKVATPTQEVENAKETEREKEKDKVKTAKETAIWYEYGCV